MSRPWRFHLYHADMGTIGQTPIAGPTNSAAPPGANGYSYFGGFSISGRGVIGSDSVYAITLLGMSPAVICITPSLDAGDPKPFCWTLPDGVTIKGATPGGALTTSVWLPDFSGGASPPSQANCDAHILIANGGIS